MELLGQWLMDLNKNNHVWFGVLTVVTMSGIGLMIAVVTEVLFKVFGIKGERIEIHH
jgi:hypothetical protein